MDEPYHCSSCNKGSNGKFCGYCGGQAQPRGVNFAGSPSQQLRGGSAQNLSGRDKMARYWQIFLKNIPQDAGKSATLLINGQFAWSSDGKSSVPATSKVDWNVPEDYGVHSDYTFNLQIASTGYDIVRTYNTSEGLSLLFEFQGLALSTLQAKANSQLR